MVAVWKKNAAMASTKLLETLSNIKIGGGLPVGTFVDLDMELQQIEEWFYEGSNDYNSTRDVFIELWSSQCAPCVEAISKMKKIHEGYSDRLQIFTIHLDIDNERVQNLRHFIEKQQIAYPVGVHRGKPSSTSTLSERFAFTHLPHGLIIDGRSHKVKWSGSLFTHDIQTVVRKRYGKPASQKIDDSSALSDLSTVAEGSSCASTQSSVELLQCASDTCQLPNGTKANFPGSVHEILYPH